MITNGVLSVGTAASRIDGRAAGSTLLTIHNNDNTDAIYLGDENVTTVNGLVVAKSERIQMVLHPLEQLYIISTKNGHSVGWLRQEN
jgi:hypothetical protein